MSFGSSGLIQGTSELLKIFDPVMSSMSSYFEIKSLAISSNSSTVIIPSALIRMLQAPSRASACRILMPFFRVEFVASPYAIPRVPINTGATAETSP